MRLVRPLLAVLLAFLILPRSATAQEGEQVFRLGEIVVIGARQDSLSGVGASLISAQEIRLFDVRSLTEAASLTPGVVATLDANGRRNEADFFVRGFGRWQVPLMIDGVRIYLPADNRLDYNRFMVGNLSAIQIQKGYASVLDGPGAMGGAVNLVTLKPVEPFQVEGGASLGGRGDVEEWSAHARVGSRQDRYYVQGAFNVLDRDSWSLSDAYTPIANSLEDGGTRLGSDTRDWGVNLKAGLTPEGNDEYTLNYMRQEGEKGGQLNVYNNPPIPMNSFWRWPWWDAQSLAFLSSTDIGETTRLKSKLYYNTFSNALFAYDDDTFSSQMLGRGFRSYYDDHAYGASIELGLTPAPRQDLKFALHYRNDVHVEWSHNRPDHPEAAEVEPEQEQAQYTWSAAVENTFHATPTVDIVAGVSYNEYAITRAEEYDEPNIVEAPKGGAQVVDWQAAVLWRPEGAGQVHASVSDRTRFPVMFELYSTRFGTATPNPDLGPERALNLELGWSGDVGERARVSTAVFYSDLRNLIQTVVLTDATTQTQNVGDGRFYGFEVSADVALAPTLRAGGNYTFIDREIIEALPDGSRPDGVPPLQPTGVPPHSALAYLTWAPVAEFEVTPSLEIASDRWSEMTTNPAAAFPYVETGAHALLNLTARYLLSDGLALTFTGRNLLDQNFEVAWGLPQPGRRLGIGVAAAF